jgi:hypothetical protein
MKTDGRMHPSTRGIVLAAGLVLMVPLLAMQVSDQVVWSPADFAVAGTLLVGTGLMYQQIARRAGHVAYRVAAGVALAAALLLVWVNLAVGVIGSEDNPANLMYLGVLAVGLIGAILARFQPHGMARTMFATALTQALVAVIALVFRLGAPENGPLVIVFGNAVFVALFAGSATLFQHAARVQDGGTAPGR